MTTTYDICDRDEIEVSALGLDVPAWISQDVTTYDVAAISHGGCASGAYMPAVMYREARETMDEHGDDVLQFIEDHADELPAPARGESWSGVAVHYLSAAVELWAHLTLDQLDDVEWPEAA